jgi:hypothetical protein
MAFEANAESFYLEGASDKFRHQQLRQAGRWNRIFNVESDHLYTPQPNNSQQSHSA